RPMGVPPKFGWCYPARGGANRGRRDLGTVEWSAVEWSALVLGALQGAVRELEVVAGRHGSEGGCGEARGPRGERQPEDEARGDPHRHAERTAHELADGVTQAVAAHPLVHLALAGG